MSRHLVLSLAAVAALSLAIVPAANAFYGGSHGSNGGSFGGLFGGSHGSHGGSFGGLFHGSHGSHGGYASHSDCDCGCGDSDESGGDHDSRVSDREPVMNAPHEVRREEVRDETTRGSAGVVVAGRNRDGRRDRNADRNRNGERKAANRDKNKDINKNDKEKKDKEKQERQNDTGAKASNEEKK